MAVEYSRSSPYFKSTIINNRMGVATLPRIPKLGDDVLVTLSEVYEYRPDLLSYDLYKTVNYWWVFAARNPSVIEDPVFDFVSGIRIYIPKQTTIERVIG